MAVMMPVTNTTIPRTQKRPWHLVKSTYKEKLTAGISTRGLEQTHCGDLKLISRNVHAPTFVWKQNTVTAMQTTAVIPSARNTAFVS